MSGASIPALQQTGRQGLGPTLNGYGTSSPQRYARKFSSTYPYATGDMKRGVGKHEKVQPRKKIAAELSIDLTQQMAWPK